MKLNSEQLGDLAVGAAFLGTGGGGNPYVGRLMAQQCLHEGLEIDIIDPSELDDGMLVIPTAMMGAPTVLVEKIPSGEEAIFSLKRLERHLGRKAQATMPIEIGGINSTIPLVVGARLGLPVVDADGMGRAYPEIDLTTFTLFDIGAAPFALADEHGNSVIINGVTNRWVERIARAAVVEFGAICPGMGFPVTAPRLREGAVLRTLSYAERIGRVIREAQDAKQDTVKVGTRGMEHGHELRRGPVW